MSAVVVIDPGIVERHTTELARLGRCGGVMGVIAAVIAQRTLKERLGMPRRTLEVVSGCEEEGSRFPATNFWRSRRNRDHRLE